jgi:uncharacterized protein YigE (DUF2233 family)
VAWAPRHIPVGRLAAVAAVAVGIVVLLRPPGGPTWREAAPGMEFALVNGAHWCRAGSANIAVLRVDPERADVRVRHCTLMSEGRPMDIVGWQRATHAAAVFNAGQYYPDLSYMGLLLSGGRVVSGTPHPTFRAALVASRIPAGGGAQVLDLERQPLDPRAPGWREVAQSFMLVDDRGTVRVRRTDHVANRTAVAEDRHGRLLVIVSEGGYTLFDFADMLRQLPLEMTHAMSMDGGAEAQLVVRTAGVRYASFGRWEKDGDEKGIPGAAAPLPAVVEVQPR